MYIPLKTPHAISADLLKGGNGNIVRYKYPQSIPVSFGTRSITPST